VTVSLGDARHSITTDSGLPIWRHVEQSITQRHRKGLHRRESEPESTAG
jgi:hypothetical protein